MFTTARLIAVGLIVGVLAMAWGIYTKRGYDLEKSKETVVQQKEQINNLSDTLEVKVVTDQVTEQTQHNVVIETQVVTEKLEKVTNKTTESVTKTQVKYRDQESTPELKEQEAREISAIRISGMWQLWCESTQEWKHPGCVPYATPVAK